MITLLAFVLAVPVELSWHDSQSGDAIVEHVLANAGRVELHHLPDHMLQLLKDQKVRAESSMDFSSGDYRAQVFWAGRGRIGPGSHSIVVHRTADSGVDITLRLDLQWTGRIDCLNHLIETVASIAALRFEMSTCSHSPPAPPRPTAPRLLMIHAPVHCAAF